MDMKGEYRIPAPRETVWAALNDPEVLKACITGCQSLDRTEDGGFEATVVAKVGPVKATFKGAVALENVNPPESYTITGEGKGGAAGFAKGGADVMLTSDGDDTVLTYTVNAQVGGKLAQIGGRLIDSTAKKYATEFFDKFVAIVTDDTPASDAKGDAPTNETADETADEPAAADQDAPLEDVTAATVIPPEPAIPPVGVPVEPAEKPKGLRPYQWIALVVAALALLVFVFNSNS